MVDYFDYHMNMQSFLRSLEETRNNRRLEEIRCRSRDRVNLQPVLRRKRPFDACLYQVRPCICVAGLSRAAIQRVKAVLAGLTDDPLPLESFHVLRKTDVKDGALLVPKIVLVAVHCPGRKLIDDQGDEGQLDFLYDEVCELGADVLVIYIDLPKVIYPSGKHYVYHPKIADLLFPTQPILQSLAMDYGLITVTEHSDFSALQKNVLREWIAKPVSGSHQIYRTAELLSGQSQSEAEWWSENEARRGGRWPVAREDEQARGSTSAKEEHPSASHGKLKSSFKRRREYGSARLDYGARRPLLTPVEDSNSLELEQYSEIRYSYLTDSTRSEQV